MKPQSFNPFLIKQLLTAACITTTAHAASGIWDNGAATQNWRDANNWNPNGAVGATTNVYTSADVATFSTTGSGTINLGNLINISGINFGVTTGNANAFIVGDADDTLNLTNGGSVLMGTGVTVTEQIGVAGTTIKLSSTTNSTYSFTNNSTTSAAKLIIAGNITTAATVAGTSVLTLGGTNGGTVSGIVSNASGTVLTGITKTGTGTWALSGANTFTGATKVNDGTLQLSGASGALALSATALSLNGGSFLIDNTTAAGGNNNTRIADTQTMRFNGGSFIYNGADAANSTETIGALTSVTGDGVFTTTFGGTNTAVVTAASFVHTAGNGTVLFNGVNLGKDTASTASVARVILTTAPVAANLVGTTAGTATGINSAVKNTKVVNYLVGEATTTTGGLGTATGTANTFLTYHATTGLRALNATDEFTNNATTTGNNIYLTTGTTAATSNAINSLVLNGGSLSIATGITATNTSGALLFVTSNSITGAGTGTLAFGAAEAQITVNTGISGTIGAIVTGSGGLIKSGGGSLNLDGNNTYTGTTIVSAGTLALNATNTTTALTLLTGGTITGSGALNGLSTINNFSTDAWTLSSNITRSGHLTYNGAAGGATSLDLSGAINLGASTNVFYVSNAGSQTDSNAITLSGSTSNTMGLTFQGENPAAIPLHTVTLAKTGGAIAVSGDITIGQGGLNWQRGIVQLGGNEQIADTAQVTLGTSGYGGNTQFRLLSYSETIEGLNSTASSFYNGATGNAIVENGSGVVGTSTLTVSGSGTYTYGPKQTTNIRIRDGSTGKLAITKDGTGTQIFSSVNELSYTGATTINNGILSIRGSNLTGSAVTLAGGTLDLQTSTINTAISGTTGQVTVSAGTTTNFGGSNKTYSVDTVISGGTTILLQTAANSLSANSIHSIGTGAILRTGNLAGSVKALTGVGSVDLNGASAILTITDGAGQDFGGAIGGAGGLIKSGANTQTLSGANTYTGNTTVNGGTLALSSSGSLTFKPTTNGTSNKITGAGTATLNGTLVLDLTSANLTSGNTWTLVDVTTPTYGLAGISSPGLVFINSSGVWTATSGSDVWTITQSSGVLSHTISSYSSWALSKGLDGTAGHENGALDDPNQNGIDNVVEYVLNGEPLLVESPAAILPTLNSSGSTFVFSFTRRVESASDTTQIFEYGTNLSGWTPLNITAPVDGAVTLGTPSGGSPNLQTVTVTVAKGGNTEMFGRLKVSKP